MANTALTAQSAAKIHSPADRSGGLSTMNPSRPTETTASASITQSSAWTFPGRTPLLSRGDQPDGSRAVAMTVSQLSG